MKANKFIRKTNKQIEIYKLQTFSNNKQMQKTILKAKIYN